MPFWPNAQQHLDETGLRFTLQQHVVAWLQSLSSIASPSMKSTRIGGSSWQTF